jgi:hypothetical protein
MSKLTLLPAMLVMALSLAACDEGLNRYNGSPDTVIATNHDTGSDAIGLQDGDAAIAYDPDGCQGWIMDDGVEGYAGRRFDPVTGLPVCDNLFPPGTVVGNYQTGSTGFPDFVPSRP